MIHSCRNVFRGAGIQVSGKWRECLGNEAECAEVEMKGPPDGSRRSGDKRSSRGSAGSDKSKSPRVNNKYFTL